METKAKDINNVIWYLTTAFNAATRNLPRAMRTADGKVNQLYELQTEFAYRLNEVTQGHRSAQQRNISLCNEYIDEVLQLCSKTDD